jgi:hypothetical protein
MFHPKKPNKLLRKQLNKESKEFGYRGGLQIKMF